MDCLISKKEEPTARVCGAALALQEQIIAEAVRQQALFNECSASALLAPLCQALS